MDKMNDTIEQGLRKQIDSENVLDRGSINRKKKHLKYFNIPLVLYSS